MVLAMLDLSMISNYLPSANHLANCEETQDLSADDARRNKLRSAHVSDLAADVSDSAEQAAGCNRV